MHHIYEVHKQVSAGAAIVTIQKPVGETVTIHHVSVLNNLTLDFGKWIGYLRGRPPHDSMQKSLYHKWIPTAHDYVHKLFNDSMDWPQNWELRLIVVTQTDNDVLRYIVAYEIAEPVKKKGWW